jgi:uncharacterized integral membrane protein
MQTRTLILLIAVLCSLAFVILNWGAITTPTSLSLGFTHVDAPLGIVLLGILVVLSILFVRSVSYLRTTLLVESRRHAKELEGQRALAENAEVSRFTELRNYLETALRHSSERDAAMQTALIAHLDAQAVAFRAVVDESGNGVAAHIGQLEDRLERAGYRGVPEGLR